MSGGENYEVIQEQDRFLPIANVARIMKRVVPQSGKLSKESKECVQECVSEFIQFIVSEASERCTTEKRKTITCEDLLQAFSTLSFDPYVDVLKAYIERYRQAVKNISASTSENQQQSNKPEQQQDTTNNEADSEASALQPVQMYVDQNGQHFMTVQYPDGTNALVPVNLINPESS